MAQEPFFPGPFKLPGSVGKQTDRAHCPFCGMTFIAKVEYVRSHVGGVTGVGVAVCKGVTASSSAESESNFASFERNSRVRLLHIGRPIATGNRIHLLYAYSSVISHICQPRPIYSLKARLTLIVRRRTLSEVCCRRLNWH